MISRSTARRLIIVLGQQKEADHEQRATQERHCFPFAVFGVTEQGDVLARYIPYGPVFRWSWNQMIPMPVQGSDLVWLLHAADEEAHSITDTEKTGQIKGK